MGGPIGYTNTVDITEKGYTGHMCTRPDGHTLIEEK